METLLQATDLSAGYGAEDILRGASFALKQGEICALLRENDPGKIAPQRNHCVPMLCAPNQSHLPPCAV